MELNKESNNLPNNMDIVVVIDKEKLPEDVRKLLEENLPKDEKEQLKLLQEKVIEMLTRQSAKVDSSQKGKIDNIARLQKDKHSNKKGIDNKLFTIQTGTVVGNIYADGTHKKEEEQSIKKKRDKIRVNLDGCC